MSGPAGYCQVLLGISFSDLTARHHILHPLQNLCAAARCRRGTPCTHPPGPTCLARVTHPEYALPSLTRQAARFQVLHAHCSSVCAGRVRGFSPRAMLRHDVLRVQPRATGPPQSNADMRARYRL